MCLSRSSPARVPMRSGPSALEQEPEAVGAFLATTAEASDPPWNTKEQRHE